MKCKILALIFALALVLSLAGCESSSGEQTQTPSKNTATTTPTSAASTPTKAASSPKDATIEEAVVVDQDGLRITVKGLDTTGGFMGPELKLLIENNSDRALTVQARDVSVNGLMITGTSLSCDVAPGKKANDSLVLFSSDLENSGIDTFASIEFKFHVFESDDWDTLFDTPAIQLETSLAQTYTQRYDDSGTTLYEEDGLRIVCPGLREDSVFGPEILLYIENQSDLDITVQIRDLSINGFMVMSSLSSDVLAGKRAYTEITLFSSDLEDNGIEQIQNAEFSFHIFDPHSWDTIKDTDSVSLSFE